MTMGVEALLTPAKPRYDLFDDTEYLDVVLGVLGGVR
jgi:hypothetical protein